jgi:hypothetical protein
MSAAAVVMLGYLLLKIDLEALSMAALSPTG